MSLVVVDHGSWPNSLVCITPSEIAGTCNAKTLVKTLCERDSSIYSGVRDYTTVFYRSDIQYHLELYNDIAENNVHKCSYDMH